MQTEKAMSPALGAAFYPPFAEDPYPFYAKARQEEPITFCPELNTWLVTRYDDLQQVLLDTETFSSINSLSFGVTFHPQAIGVLMQGYPMVPMVFNSDGADHIRLRTPLTKALSSARIKALEPFIREAANNLVDNLANQQRVEMMDQFAYPLALQVIHKLLGMPLEDVTRTKKWIHDWLRMMSTQLDEERQVECAQSTIDLQRYLGNLIAERKANPQDDVISVLLTATDPGDEPLSETELVYMLQGLILPGHLNPTNMIGTGLQLLLDRPEQWQRLCEHPESIPLAVEEIIRFDGSIRSFGRITTREVTVGGVTLPENTPLLLIYGSGNRDEAVFADAHKFQPQRAATHHLGFGHGVHYCVGAALARLEGRVTFEVLTSRLPQMRLVSGQELTHIPTINFRGYERLEVTL